MSARADGWDAARDYLASALEGSFGKVVTAGRPSLHPTRDVVAAGTEIREELMGPALPHVVLFERGAAISPNVLRKGRLPVWSPDGATLAHLDDRAIWIGDTKHALIGQPERLAWKSDSTALLVAIAEDGSEVSNLAGSGLHGYADEADAWMPWIASSMRHVAWRRVLVIDALTGAQRVLSRPDLNIWDATWAGDSVLVVASDGSASESQWFASDLRLIDATTGIDTIVLTPPTAVQLGPIAGSPSGRHIAYVLSVCSDRDLVAGDLFVHDLQAGDALAVASGVDVGDVSFIDDQTLGFGGIRGVSSVLGTASTAGEHTVWWESQEETALGIYPSAGYRPGGIAFTRAGFRKAPELVIVRAPGADPENVASLEHPGANVYLQTPGTLSVQRWKAADGWDVEGWLHLPEGEGPHPIVMLVHGGPVSNSRSGWNALGAFRPYLVSQGYGVFLPNPRGSSGYGQTFASAVVGDMGGADAQDLISGIEHLIAQGIADPGRIGVTGGSYGGFMSAWLISQCDLFAASIPKYPVADWSIQHGASNIPFWDELFLDGKPYATDGEYIARSPLAQADKVKTPTLLIGGAMDRATPCEQAVSLHRALASRGVPTECVIYPNAGHGVHEMGAVIDDLARTLAWFQRWMPAKS